MNDAVLDSEHEKLIRESIERQTMLATLGVEVAEIAAGRVVLELPFRTDICQQNGFVHAGAITTVADSACGYAAQTLMQPGSDVLSVEFKVNLLRPGVGERFRAEAAVVRSGRNITVCSADVLALAPDRSTKQIALMQATMMTVRADD
ncbi:hypothetical protein N566_16785 [Streptomycetaceae bacterium MP113-05]|nr:hypothetical protein N566_16785 [Streptomycetaceae bacterium MP113-05]